MPKNAACRRSRPSSGSTALPDRRFRMGKGSPVASTAWHFPDVFRQISVEQWRAALHNSCARLGDSAQLEPSSSETTQGGANPYSEVIVAARSSLKGYLKFSLVSLQVKAYPATTSDGGSVKLNQLHIDCHSRINYKKTCPNHGEVSNDAIVSGYEYQKGQYVIVDTDELEKLRTEDDKAIQIDTFINPDDLDPVYYAGKTYYLVPDGPVGQKTRDEQ